jgi:hypothetical protein
MITRRLEVLCVSVPGESVRNTAGGLEDGPAESEFFPRVKHGEVERDRRPSSGFQSCDNHTLSGVRIVLSVGVKRH